MSAANVSDCTFIALFDSWPSFFCSEIESVYVSDDVLDPFVFSFTVAPIGDCNSAGHFG